MAKVIAIGTIVLFLAAVIVMSTIGRPLLTQIGMCDTTVSYLDLARQASEHRDYEQADRMYKQALMYARLNDPTGQAESAMLLTYAKFAYEKKHDRQLATELQKRAAELRARAKAAAATTVQ